jgi:hypothetical protein
MDRKVIISCFLLTLIISISACDDEGKYKNETTQIDSLISGLEKAEQDFEKAPYEKAEEIEKKAKSQLAEIQKLVSDTLNRRAAILIGQYANIAGHEEEEKEKDEGKSDFGEKEVEYIEKELKFSIKQLKDLRHDLVSGNLTLESFRKHFENEKRATERIVRVADMKVFRWKQIVELSDSLEPAILQLTDSLRQIKK